MDSDAFDFEGFLEILKVCLKFRGGIDCEMIPCYFIDIAKGWIRIVFGFSLNHFSTAFLNLRPLLIKLDWVSKYSQYRLIMIHLLFIIAIMNIAISIASNM